jgi:hypothetical protein
LIDSGKKRRINVIKLSRSLSGVEAIFLASAPLSQRLILPRGLSCQEALNLTALTDESMFNRSFLKREKLNSDIKSSLFVGELTKLARLRIFY